MASGGKERGFLGVRVVELGEELKSHLGDPTLEGVVVTEVLAASPAESVGLAAGGRDHILRFDAALVGRARCWRRSEPPSRATWFRCEFVRDSRHDDGAVSG